MPSKTFATNDILTAADMNLFALAPQVGTITTEQATSSSSYTDLATVGPSVTLNLNNGQIVELWIRAYALSTTNTAIAWMSWAISGASGTINPADADGIRWREGTAGSEHKMQTSFGIFTATATGSHTFTCKYKSDGSASYTWGHRRIMAVPKF